MTALLDRPAGARDVATGASLAHVAALVVDHATYRQLSHWIVRFPWDLLDHDQTVRCRPGSGVPHALTVREVDRLVRVARYVAAGMRPGPAVAVARLEERATTTAVDLDVAWTSGRGEMT